MDIIGDTDTGLDPEDAQEDTDMDPDVIPVR